MNSKVKISVTIFAILISLCLGSCGNGKNSGKMDLHNLFTSEYQTQKIEETQQMPINFLPYFREDAGKYGYANDMGEIIVEPKYDKVRDDFLNSFIAPVSISKKWGFVDTKGSMILPLQFDYVGTMTNDRIVVKRDNKYGFVDYNGKIVVEPKFSWATNFFDTGLSLVETDGKYGFIDKNGNYAVEPVLEDVGGFNDAWTASVLLDGKYGLVNNAGEMVLEPQFDEIKNFKKYYDLAIVEKNGKYGCINIYGEIIIDVVYDDIYFDLNDRLTLIKGGEKVLMNEDGEIVDY